MIRFVREFLESEEGPGSVVTCDDRVGEALFDLSGDISEFNSKPSIFEPIYIPVSARIDIINACCELADEAQSQCISTATSNLLSQLTTEGSLVLRKDFIESCSSQSARLKIIEQNTRLYSDIDYKCANYSSSQANAICDDAERHWPTTRDVAINQFAVFGVNPAKCDEEVSDSPVWSQLQQIKQNLELMCPLHEFELDNMGDSKLLSK